MKICFYIGGVTIMHPPKIKLGPPVLPPHHCLPWWSQSSFSPFLSPPTGMIGYGMAKGAVHQLCQSLAGTNSGMPVGAAAIALLP